MSRIAAVSCALLPLLPVAGLCVVLSGCAQGFEGPESFGFDALGSGSQGDGSKPGSAGGGGGGGTTPTGGMAGGLSGMGAGAGAFDGDPCLRGETEACVCASGGMGSRSCGFDADSPTEGSFGECARCAAAGGAGGASGMGGAGGMSGSGSGGSSSAGRSGAGGAGSGASGSGGSGSAGSGGSTSPPPSGGSKPGWCVFVPIPIPGC